MLLYSLRDLAERRLPPFSRPPVLLELMYEHDLHYLTHLLNVAGRSPFLPRRIKLFHALAHGCLSCCRQLSATFFAYNLVHLAEIPRYWAYFNFIAPGRISHLCTCQPNERERCLFAPALLQLEEEGD